VSVANASLMAELSAGYPCLWRNTSLARAVPPTVDTGGSRIGLANVQSAQTRFQRFAPLLADLFPELAAGEGLIESPLLPAPALQQALEIPVRHGALWIKADHDLPVAGSIKARGGIHEVLEYAEKLALRHELVQAGGDYRALGKPAARALFGRYRISVGSTGNLGLSIGIIAAALGFRATVHMSADAKEWKKARLRAHGVEVVEHGGDYADAVAAGRVQAKQDPYGYFIDDERSLSLLLGYSSAALHLREQLSEQAIQVDAEHPLFVYLPCGVGGAPSGIAFGLKQIFGPHVHCFFAEPTQSPCFMLQMMLGAAGGNPSVYDIGLSNRTEADGLAVPRASLLAAWVMRTLLSGAFTVGDDTLFRHLYLAGSTQNLRIEPSAAAGFSGPPMLHGTPQGRAYLQEHGLEPRMPQATHLVWTTGGLFVPDDEYQRFFNRGKACSASR